MEHSRHIPAYLLYAPKISSLLAARTLTNAFFPVIMLTTDISMTDVSVMVAIFL